MFFCEPCRKESDWPFSGFRSFGRCEVCKNAAECYDVPSYRLPKPVPTERDLFEDLTDDSND